MGQVWKIKNKDIYIKLVGITDIGFLFRRCSETGDEKNLTQEDIQLNAAIDMLKELSADPECDISALMGLSSDALNDAYDLHMEAK